MPDRRFSRRMRLFEADRPATLADEDRVLLAAYRQALERICKALGMPGSPSLIEAVPAEVERRLGKPQTLCGHPIHIDPELDPAGDDPPVRFGSYATLVATNSRTGERVEVPFVFKPPDCGKR